MKFKFSLLWVSLVGFLLFTCSDTSEVDPPAENTQINVDTEQNDDETNECVVIGVREESDCTP